MYSEFDVMIGVLIVGISTYFFRVFFLFYVPKFLHSSKVKVALDAIPIGMLVALVVPTTLLVDQKINVARLEVLAILFSVPVIYHFRKAGVGILSAVFIYVTALVIL